MKSRVRFLIFLTSIFALLAMFSSCAVTTDSTKSSSNTTGNTSEASTKFTSSTSPGGGSSSDNNEAKALEFTNENFARVKSDMAVGGGEHLETLSSLLGIADSRRSEFYSLAKNNFSELVVSEQTTAEEMLTKLKATISVHPELKD